MESGPQLTRLVRSWSEGNQGALDELVPLVYKESHRLAQRCMADERFEHTLQANVLVNEACLRLVDWPCSRHAQKPGSDVPPLELDSRKSQIVESRFFGGLSVKGNRNLAKSWLRTELESHGS
jgi:hypothetical protein